MKEDFVRYKAPRSLGHLDHSRPEKSTRVFWSVQINVERQHGLLDSPDRRHGSKDFVLCCALCLTGCVSMRRGRSLSTRSSRAVRIASSVPISNCARSFADSSRSRHHFLTLLRELVRNDARVTPRLNGRMEEQARNEFDVCILNIFCIFTGRSVTNPGEYLELEGLLLKIIICLSMLGLINMVIIS